MLAYTWSEVCMDGDMLPFSVYVYPQPKPYVREILC